MIVFCLLLVTIHSARSAATELRDCEYCHRHAARCAAGHVVLNECVRCKCSDEHLYQCESVAHGCDHDKNVIPGKSSKAKCEPRMIYVLKSVTCMCSKSGFWPHDKCEATFNTLYDAESDNKLDPKQNHAKPAFKKLLVTNHKPINLQNKKVIAANCHHEHSKLFEGKLNKHEPESKESPTNDKDASNDPSEVTSQLPTQDNQVNSAHAGDLVEPGERCTPNKYFTRDCNVCRCNAQGTIERCTKNNCKKKIVIRRNSDSIHGSCEPENWYSLGPCQFCFCQRSNKLVCSTGYSEQKTLLELGSYNLTLCGKAFLQEASELVPRPVMDKTLRQGTDMNFFTESPFKLRTSPQMYRTTVPVSARLYEPDTINYANYMPTEVSRDVTPENFVAPEIYDIADVPEKSEKLENAKNLENANNLENTENLDNAEILDNAGNPQAAENFDNVYSLENAETIENAEILEDMKKFENTKSFENVEIGENAEKFENYKNFENVEIGENAEKFQNSKSFENFETVDNAENLENIKKFENTKSFQNVENIEKFENTKSFENVESLKNAEKTENARSLETVGNLEYAENLENPLNPQYIEHPEYSDNPENFESPEHSDNSKTFDNPKKFDNPENIHEIQSKSTKESTLGPFEVDGYENGAADEKPSSFMRNPDESHIADEKLSSSVHDLEDKYLFEDKTKTFSDYPYKSNPVHEDSNYMTVIEPAPSKPNEISALMSSQGIPKEMAEILAAMPEASNMHSPLLESLSTPQPAQDKSQGIKLQIQAEIPGERPGSSPRVLRINLPSVLDRIIQMALRKSMVKIDNSRKCAPGTTSQDGCNFCYCLTNGKLLCTDKKTC